MMSSSSRASARSVHPSPLRRSSNRRSQTSATPSLFSLSNPFRIFLLHVLALRCVRAADVYVDDNDSSVSYSPGDSWAQGSGCGSCALSPSSGSAYDGTWHDTTYYPDGSGRTITFRFTGTSISAYFIIPDRAQGTASVDTSLSFTLDESQTGTYTHSASGSTDFLYNQRAFSTSGLSNAEHTLVISAGATSSGGSTAVLFDYFIYTMQDESSTTAAPLTSTATQSPQSPNTSPSSTSSSSPPSNNSGSSTSLNGASSSTSESSQTGTSTGSTSGTAASSVPSGTVSPDSASGGQNSVSATGANSASPSQSESSGNNTSSFPNSASGSGSGSGSSSSNVGAVVGGVVGGILGLIALLALLLCWRKRRRQVGSAYGDEVPFRPTAVPESNSGWLRRLFCLSDSPSSNLAPHPVIFIDRSAPSSPGQGTEKRSFGNTMADRAAGAAGIYNGKGRPPIQREEVSETTENVSSPTSPTTTYPGNTQTNQNRSGGGTNELGPEATAILTQVAALQAVVLSLQEQRARERERIGDSVEIGVAPPPQYSRTP